MCGCPVRREPPACSLQRGCILLHEPFFHCGSKAPFERTGSLLRPPQEVKFCMFLAPTCSMSAYCPPIPHLGIYDLCHHRRLNSSRAAAKSSSPLPQGPGRVGACSGLEGAARKICPPASFTAFAAAKSCSSFPQHKACHTTSSGPPMVTLPTFTTVVSF